MFDLNQMTLADWQQCGKALSEIATTAQSMEQVAEGIVAYLYDTLGVAAENDAPRACALVRLYKTHAYQRLPLPLMDFADAVLEGQAVPFGMKCLTLLATAGDEPAWNDRTQSAGHQAIPLVNSEMVARIPMVARLVEQFGLDTRTLLQADAELLNPDLILELAQKKYRVFHVEDAVGSPYIPAQANFVQRYGLRSVVGFGGLLPSGDLYAVILFSRVSVARSTAEEFASLALPVKIALLPFTYQNVFR